MYPQMNLKPPQKINTDEATQAARAKLLAQIQAQPAKLAGQIRGTRADTIVTDDAVVAGMALAANVKHEHDVIVSWLYEMAAKLHDDVSGEFVLSIAEVKAKPLVTAYSRVLLENASSFLQGTVAVRIGYFVRFFEQGHPMWEQATRSAGIDALNQMLKALDPYYT